MRSRRPFSLSVASRARAAWSTVAVGGNGAGAITRRKLTFLGEITFTKYLISSPAREESLPTAFKPRGRGECAFVLFAAKTVTASSRLRYGIPHAFAACLSASLLGWMTALIVHFSCYDSLQGFSEICTINGSIWVFRRSNVKSWRHISRSCALMHFRKITRTWGKNVPV